MATSIDIESILESHTDVDSVLEEIQDELARKKKALTPFEMGTLSWRALYILSEINKGGNSDLYKKLCTEDKNMVGGYYMATLNNQNFAIHTKKPLFCEPNHLHGTCTAKWRTSMEKKVPTHDPKISMLQLMKKINSNELMYEACTATTSGTANMKMKRSKFATEKGTYIHDMLGKQILERACLASPSYRAWIAAGGKCEQVLPGRVFSPSFYYMAGTPDGITVPSSDLFFECYSALSKLDPYKPIPEELAAKLDNGGAPLFVHEIKTSQTTQNGPKGTGTMIVREDVVPLHAQYLREGADSEDLKRKVVTMLAKYMSEGGGVISKKDVVASDYVIHPAEEEPPKKKAPKKRKAGGEESVSVKKSKYGNKFDMKVVDHTNNKCGMFGRSMKLCMPSAYDLSKIEKLGGDTVPYLCEHTLFKTEDKEHEMFGRELTCTSQVKGKVLDVEGDHYPARKLLGREQGCIITFFDYNTRPIGERTEGKRKADLDISTDQLFPLMTFEFDEPPFVLAVNGDFKRQTMVQVAALRHMNVNINSIFTEVLSYYVNGTSSPCVQISWCQRFRKDVIRDFMQHTAQKCAEIDPIMNASLLEYGYEPFSKAHAYKGITFEEMIENKKAEEEKSTTTTNEEDDFADLFA
ncbi:ORF93 [Haliotid herpesvirus 1]|uniref:Uncharacterized protein n=1 Tax=Abalone herpesvirus Taiwan/2005 TaxID=1821058 RepID=A0A143DIB7_9VIRU|nr:hypothetical protein tc2005_p116 [Abalone herpesvirus Taiwan/2005]UCX57084.1 ORF93 [Haliotid herpesvirus 1]